MKYPKYKILDNFTFNVICAEYYVEPCIALESEAVIKAIKNQDIEKLVEILENDF